MKGLYMYYNPQNRFINYFKKLFGKGCARHPEIVKKLKKRNENIYSTVMVGISIYQSINPNST